ncbi:MAG: hypothetical protein K2O54_07250, partial [Prevotella sp.]|nr:hypothetical protein [Prevotella sp.]
ARNDYESYITESINYKLEALQNDFGCSVEDIKIHDGIINGHQGKDVIITYDEPSVPDKAEVDNTAASEALRVVGKIRAIIKMRDIRISSLSTYVNDTETVNEISGVIKQYDEVLKTLKSTKEG